MAVCQFFGSDDIPRVRRIPHDAFSCFRHVVLKRIKGNWTIQAYREHRIIMPDDANRMNIHCELGESVMCYKNEISMGPFSDDEVSFDYAYYIVRGIHPVVAMYLVYNNFKLPGPADEDSYMYVSDDYTIFEAASKAEILTKLNIPPANDMDAFLKMIAGDPKWHLVPKPHTPKKSNWNCPGITAIHDLSFGKQQYPLPIGLTMDM